MRKRGVVGRIYGMKYSADNYTHKIYTIMNTFKNKTKKWADPTRNIDFRPTTTGSMVAYCVKNTTLQLCPHHSKCHRLIIIITTSLHYVLLTHRVNSILASKARRSDYLYMMNKYHYIISHSGKSFWLLGRSWCILWNMSCSHPCVKHINRELTYNILLYSSRREIKFAVRSDSNAQISSRQNNWETDWCCF